MVLPSFIIIGAQKAATTTLWAQLRQHPDVFMPELKETNFFIDHRRRQLGQAWYESLFEPAAPGQVVGEASPAYTLFPLWRQVPQQISELLPQVKLVYILRDPIERMRSSWVQARSDGLELLALHQALTQRLLYVSGSSYALQAEQFLRHFPRHQLLLLSAEDLETDAGATYDLLLDFLGLEPGWRPGGDVRHNASAGKRVLRTRGDLAARVVARLGRQASADRVRLAAHGDARWQHMLSRELSPDDLHIDGELRDSLVRLLEPDLRRLLPILGRTSDPWGILDSA